MKHKASTVSAIARRCLTRGDGVLEIGAADGEFSRIYASRVGRRGHVLAVEPDARQAGTLRLIAKSMPWVKVWHGAVGSGDGRAPFYADQSNPKRSSLWRGNVPDPGEPSDVPVTTVDALVASMPRTPALIQVDAQGAEVEILAGASQTLRLPIVWVIEMWASGLMRAGASVYEAMGAFRANAYTPRTIRGRCLEWTEAYGAAVSRQGYAHADFVMVPPSMAGVSW